MREQILWPLAVFLIYASVSYAELTGSKWLFYDDDEVEEDSPVFTKHSIPQPQPQTYVDPFVGYTGGSSFKAGSNQENVQQHSNYQQSQPARHAGGSQGMYLQSINHASSNQGPLPHKQTHPDSYGRHPQKSQQADSRANAPLQPPYSQSSFASPMNHISSFSKERQTPNEPKKEPPNKINEWLFGDLTSEQEEEKRRDEQRYQETVQYNLQRQTQVQIEKADERRRAEEQQRDEERRREESKRHGFYQEQLRQRENEMTALQNKFDEQNRKLHQDRNQQEYRRAEYDASHASPLKYHHRAPHKTFEDDEDSDGDNPPSLVLLKKKKGFFTGFLGNNSQRLKPLERIFLLLLFPFCLNWS